MDTHLTFGKWLRQRRRFLDLTQKELARQVGCALSTIRKFEADERRPSKALAARLAECLNLAPAEVENFIAFARAKPYLEPVAPPPDHTFSPAQTGRRLPTPPTSFIGREQELAKIIRLLSEEPHCRLLTLIGPGGIGKTRLATKAAERLDQNFTGGVYFVPLAGVNGPDALLHAIADMLHLSFSGGLAPKTQLLNYLDSKAMLLILDNFEHLTSAAASKKTEAATDLLVDILITTSPLKILVTSRERLNLQAEWLVSLQGLSYPAAEPAPNGVAYEAVELFRQRARHTQPNFDLAVEWPDVARICQLVAGMPLAIELAAAWVHRMPCAEIAGELAKNLDLLATSWRDLPARHRSLRVVFDQSWYILSNDEKTALRKLSVFQGGFNRPAAQAVAGANLAHLSALVDKSLLHRTQTGRYELHELLRQFAAEKLNQQEAECEQVRRQHARYYADVLHGLGSDLKGEKQRAGLEKIATDIDNIRTAWQWAVDQGDIETVQLAQESLGLFYNMRGRMQEGYTAFSRAVTQFSTAEGQPSSQRQIVLGNLLATLGQFCVYLGLFEEGERHLQQSVRRLRQAGNMGKRELALALRHLGELHALQGRSIDIIRQNYEESLSIFTEIDDRWGMIETLLELGILAHERPTSYAEAERHLQACVRLCRQLGERKIRAFATICLGRVAMDTGDYDQARQQMQEGFRIFKKLGVPMGIAYSQRDLGVLLTKTGAYNKAAQYLQESLVISKEMGDRRGEAVCLNILGYIACLQARYGQAEHLHRQCLTILDEIGQQGYRSDCLIRLGRVAFDQSQYKQAKQLYEEGLAGTKQLAFRWNMAIALNYLGQISCILKYPDDIWPNFYKALQISLDVQSPPLTLEILTGLALCLSTLHQADKERAIELLILAQHHPAATYDTKNRAARLLTKLEAELSPTVAAAAIHRGQTRDLQATVETFLKELPK